MRHACVKYLSADHTSTQMCGHRTRLDLTSSAFAAGTGFRADGSGRNACACMHTPTEHQHGGPLRQVLVTKQTGPAGKPVNTLYIAKKMKLANEMYFAILLDRASAGPMIIACSEGNSLAHYLRHGADQVLVSLLCAPSR